MDRVRRAVRVTVGNRAIMSRFVRGSRIIRIIMNQSARGNRGVRLPAAASSAAVLLRILPTVTVPSADLHPIPAEAEAVPVSIGAAADQLPGLQAPAGPAPD